MLGEFGFKVEKGLEMTKNVSVPEGYKKTELGVIPEEWNILELKKCVREAIKDGTHSTPKYVSEGIPFITVANMSERKIDFEACKKITPEEHAELSKRTKPENGDILLSKVGTL